MARILTWLSPPFSFLNKNMPNKNSIKAGVGGNVLETKVDIPSLQNSVLRRSRLVKLLGQSGDSKVTFLIAPAGYGKTTLLVEWLSSASYTHEHTAWVTLDPFDNSPSRFWAYIIAALRKVFPQITDNLNPPYPLPTSPQNFEELIPLINEISQLQSRFNLVLDDYQAIDREEIHQSLGYLIDHQPKNMHLILSSRKTPPIPLARLRVQQRLTELTVKDLAFNFKEINSFLQQVLGLKIERNQLVTLQQATEGWVAGLQLIALSLQGRPDFLSQISNLAKGNCQIFSYLAEEVLNRQDPAIREFLLKTCLLSEFSAPLCDELLGRTDSQNLIHQIEMANLFIVALDERQQWYRYQSLFANALAHHIQVNQPELIPSLHSCCPRLVSQQRIPSQGSCPCPGRWRLGSCSGYRRRLRAGFDHPFRCCQPDRLDQALLVTADRKTSPLGNLLCPGIHAIGATR